MWADFNWKINYGESTTSANWFTHKIFQIENSNREINEKDHKENFLPTEKLINVTKQWNTF